MKKNSKFSLYLFQISLFFVLIISSGEIFLKLIYASNISLKIKEVKVIQEEKESKMIITSNLPLNCKWNTLNNPERFYIDIFGVNDDYFKLDSRPPGHGIIKRIRKCHHNKTKNEEAFTRITVDLTNKFRFDLKQNGTKIIITLSPGIENSKFPPQIAPSPSSPQNFNPALVTLNNEEQRMGKKERNEPTAFEINFNEADIKTVIKTFSEMTGKNFIIDEKVRGKVSIVSQEKVPIEEAYKVFLSLLEVTGYTIVSNGSINKIIPIKDAVKSDVETFMGKDVDEKNDIVITQLIPLTYADSNQVRTLLAPLISRGGNILSYTHTNTIIITELKSNISRLTKIINEIDIRGAKENIRVISLNYASAEQLAKELSLIIKTGTFKDIQKDDKIPSPSKP
ncbi:MAG: secretin N-terminal domain-containing protein, partial [bacterium]